MKFRYTVTEKAYLDFNMYHILNSPYLRKQARLARIMPFMFWLLLLGVDAFTSGVFSPGFSLAFITLGALWFLFYPAYYRKANKKRLKRYIDEGNGQEYIGDQSLELLDDRMRTEDKTGLREMPYAIVDRLVENQDCLYIFIGAMTAVIVPQSAFDGDNFYPDFRAYLEGKIRLAKTAAGNSEEPSGASGEQ